MNPAFEVGTEVEHIYRPGFLGKVIPTGQREDGIPSIYQARGDVNVRWSDGRIYHHPARFIKEAD